HTLEPDPGNAGGGSVAHRVAASAGFYESGDRSQDDASGGWLRGRIMRASESQNRLFRTSRERNAGSPARRGGRRLWRLAVAVVLLSAFAAGTALAQSITVLTHGSFALPTELVEDFTATTGIEVEFLMGGDAGEVVNRAILTKGR